MVALVQSLDKVLQPLLNLPHLVKKQFKTNNLFQEKHLFQLLSQQYPAASKEPLLGLLVLGHLLQHLKHTLILDTHEL